VSDKPLDLDKERRGRDAAGGQIANKLVADK